MDVSLHVQVYAVLDHQGLERLLTGQADCSRAVLGGDVPRSMETDDDPGRLFTIDGGEIFLKPIVLLVRVSKRTVVCAGVGATSFVRRLESDGEVSFTIEHYKVGEAVIEGVPEVPEATRFVRGHAEMVDCRMERSSYKVRGG